jgi:hypothetical protein
LNPAEGAVAERLTVHDLVPGVNNEAAPQFTELRAGEGGGGGLGDEEEGAWMLMVPALVEVGMEIPAGEVALAAMSCTEAEPETPAAV